MVLCYDDDEVMLYRAIGIYRVIASSRYRLFCTYAVQNGNKGIFIPETLIFLAYCCKIIKKVSNCFYFSLLIDKPEKM